MKWELDSVSGVSNWAHNITRMAKNTLKKEGNWQPMAIVWARVHPQTKMPFAFPTPFPVIPTMYQGAWTPLYREAWAKELRKIAVDLDCAAIAIIMESRYTLFNPRTGRRCQPEECISISLEHEDPAADNYWVADIERTSGGVTIAKCRTLTQAACDRFGGKYTVNATGAMGIMSRLLPQNSLEAN